MIFEQSDIDFIYFGSNGVVKNDFQEMSKVLLSYAEFLKSAATNYRNTEESLKDAAGNLYTGN